MKNFVIFIVLVMSSAFAVSTSNAQVKDILFTSDGRVISTIHSGDSLFNLSIKQSFGDEILSGNSGEYSSDGVVCTISAITKEGWVVNYFLPFKLTETRVVVVVPSYILEKISGPCENKWICLWRGDKFKGELGEMEPPFYNPPYTADRDLLFFGENLDPVTFTVE